MQEERNKCRVVLEVVFMPEIPCLVLILVPNFAE
jgi:hypothetical protein